MQKKHLDLVKPIRFVGRAMQVDGKFVIVAAFNQDQDDDIDAWMMERYESVFSESKNKMHVLKLKKIDPNHDALKEIFLCY